MPKRLDADERIRRKLKDSELADAIGRLQAEQDALKAEAIRRELRRAEGLDYRIVLSPPATQQRTDKDRLLRVLGISAGEFAARFCDSVQTGWRLTCTKLRKVQSSAASL